MAELIEASPLDPRLKSVIQTHLAAMRAASPPDSSHALTPEALAGPGVRFFALCIDDCVQGVGALKLLSRTHAELKSMHVLAASRGRGLGRVLLRELIESARQEGIKQISLETGRRETYLAAIALYHSEGFIECGPFADYSEDVESLFLTCFLS